MRPRVVAFVATGVLSLAMPLRGQAASPPLSYYLGRDVAVIDVTTTVTTMRRIVDTTNPKACTVQHGKPDKTGTVVAVAHELCVTEKDPTTIREGKSALQLVPDTNLAVPLNNTSGALTDDHQIVEFRDGMLLKSLNVTSVGRAGDILMSVAKFVGVIVGGASIFSFSG